MHILVVDDDIPTVEVIRTSLHWDLLGIDRVETAYDYTEAQNKICASQPDIILCDIEMPRGSGLDLLRWLREEKRDCEFVFLTCHANFDYAKTALQYGAADYITKPFNIAQTEATLSKVASQVRYHQELLQKSRAGQQWEEAHSLAQASFLHGLFMDGTLMTEIELNKRFQDLGLAVDALQPIHMVLPPLLNLLTIPAGNRNCSAMRSVTLPRNFCVRMPPPMYSTFCGRICTSAWPGWTAA